VFAQDVEGDVTHGPAMAVPLDQTLTDVEWVSMNAQIPSGPISLP
jgi:hypothetical protein